MKIRKKSLWKNYCLNNSKFHVSLPHISQCSRVLPPWWITSKGKLSVNRSRKVTLTHGLV